MRCRLILLISQHPIQQGIRKGGGPHFCDEDEEKRGMAYSWQLDIFLENILRGEPGGSYLLNGIFP